MDHFSVGGEPLAIEPALRIECSGNGRGRYGVPSRFVTEGISRTWQVGKVSFFCNPDAVWLGPAAFNQEGIAVLPWKDGFDLSAAFGGRVDWGALYFGRIDFVGDKPYGHRDNDCFLNAFREVWECG